MLRAAISVVRDLGQPAAKQSFAVLRSMVTTGREVEAYCDVNQVTSFGRTMPYRGRSNGVFGAL